MTLLSRETLCTETPGREASVNSTVKADGATVAIRPRSAGRGRFIRAADLAVVCCFAVSIFGCASTETLALAEPPGANGIVSTEASQQAEHPSEAVENGNAAESQTVRQTAWLVGDIDTDEIPTLDSPAVHEPSLSAVKLTAVEFDSEDATCVPPCFPSSELTSDSELELSDDETFRSSTVCWWQSVKSDHCHFYSEQSLARLAGGTLIAGVMANTSIDRKLHDGYQASVASQGEWSELFHSPKVLGNGKYTIPTFVVAWAAGAAFDETRTGSLVGDWGERSLRTFLVGVPPLIVMQQLTGGSRPGETAHNSEWRPFHDDNGVSGHSFMGALPFLTAAKMTDNPWLKVAFYVGSTATGISRINDSAHYPSQAVLGWWIAWLATDAVDRTQAASSTWTLAPYPDPQTTGIALAVDF